MGVLVLVLLVDLRTPESCERSSAIGSTDSREDGDREDSPPELKTLDNTPIVKIKQCPEYSVAHLFFLFVNYHKFF